MPVYFLPVVVSDYYVVFVQQLPVYKGDAAVQNNTVCSAVVCLRLLDGGKKEVSLAVVADEEEPVSFVGKPVRCK